MQFRERIITSRSRSTVTTHVVKAVRSHYECTSVFVAQSEVVGNAAAAQILTNDVVLAVCVVCVLCLVCP